MYCWRVDNGYLLVDDELSMELQGDDGQRPSQETFPKAKFSKFVELGIKKDISVVVMKFLVEGQIVFAVLVR